MTVDDCFCKVILAVFVSILPIAHQEVDDDVKALSRTVKEVCINLRVITIFILYDLGNIASGVFLKKGSRNGQNVIVLEANID